ncbi:tRNA (adenosine(37)-N6)-dimethylallyltransferase MiaA [Roseicyclus sp.]|uniref:tRNA (adenosine(37)-N6)-dimethylallyltransferase MiaA n=1 Tax=Roseicyclus sp. TaxID=1914329 RepID=UPI003F6D60AD
MIELNTIPDNFPVLIAGPTASGKSALALRIAQAQGGIIVNADALQVYENWRVLTARPDAADLAAAPHHLYGHVGWDTPYSVGHWLREVTDLIDGQRPIIVGGTGLYFRALTEGLAEIPPTPPEIRALADGIALDEMIATLDPDTAAGIDLHNRARVQRAWEVLEATGQGLAAWQATTPAPLLPPAACFALRIDAPVDWLNERITRRFDAMLDRGALEEAEANWTRWDPNLPSMKAIGAPELMSYLHGEMTLAAARDAAIIASRQYAKRQRTWFRARLGDWRGIDPSR